MSKKIRCGCTGAKAYCKFHSKIKMKVMLKEEYKTSYQTTVFYSFFKEEKKDPKAIIKIMLSRLEKNFTNAYNCILFYDTITDKSIHKHS